MSAWTKDLDAFLDELEHELEGRRTRRVANETRVNPFFERVVIPALQEMSAGFRKRGIAAAADAALNVANETRAAITFYDGRGEQILAYAIRAKANSAGFSLYAQASSYEGSADDEDISAIIDSADPKGDLILLVLDAWKAAVTRRQLAEED